MIRRFLVIASKGTLAFLLLVCLGCSAQQGTNELTQRIERQLRVTYNVPPNVKVVISTPHSSEFPNYDAITATFDDGGKKQNYDFLLSQDRNTLIRMTKMDLSKDPYAEVMKKIDTKGRPVRGNANAKVVAVNYDDFQCPYCSRAHETLFPALFKEYGDRITFIYKDSPLSDIHPWATRAAINANCLADQSNDAYWDFADYIHANRQTVNEEQGLDKQFAALDKITFNEGGKFKLDSSKLEACVKAQKGDAVKASVREGEALGVSGTPTMFVNGQMLDGARSPSEMRAVFDSALQQAGVSVPSRAQVPATTNPSSPSGAVQR